MKKVISGLLLLSLVTGCSSDGSAQRKSESDQATETSKRTTIAETPSKGNSVKTYPVRNENNPIVTIDTDFGKMVLELYRDVAPAHADSFVARTKEGFYDSLLFFRIMDNFMVQTGDPQNRGSGNAGYYLNAEFSDLPHEEGTLSMARAQSPNSASCQFFIVLTRNQTTAYLDGKYSVFGHLLSGFEVLHKIGSVPVGPNPRNPAEQSSPLQPVRMLKVYLSDINGNPI